MSDALIVERKRQISPSGSLLGSALGEKCRFVPYRLKHEALRHSLSIICRLALNPEYDSATLRANAGLMMLIESAKTRIVDGQALARNQVMYATGLDAKTVKKALANPNSLVRITKNGQRWDYKSGTAQATRYAMTIPDIEFTSNLRFNALAPNHPMWRDLGTNAWRLALSYYFNNSAGVFASVQVRGWTGWDQRTAQRVLVKISGIFVAKVARGEYRFDPFALVDTPVQAPIPAHIEKGRTLMGLRKGAKGE